MLLASGCSYLTSLDAAKVISYAIDTRVLVSSLIELDSTVAVARSSVNENKDKFTIGEWNKLKVAGEQIDEMRVEFERIFGPEVDVKTRVISSVKLKYIVGDVFDTYDSIESIVLLHAEQFSSAQRLQVLTAKRTVDNLRDSYNNIKATAAGAETNSTIDATETVLKAVKAVKKIAAVFIDE